MGLSRLQPHWLVEACNNEVGIVVYIKCYFYVCIDLISIGIGYKQQNQVQGIGYSKSIWLMNSNVTADQVTCDNFSHYLDEVCDL